MAINEMGLRRFLGAVKKRLERHDTLLKQHRERDLKMLKIIRQLLEINEGTIAAMPTDRELSARRASRKKLSKAERPVYELMFTCRNKEIAEKLGLSIHTVKNHTKSIRRKLGITRGRKNIYMNDTV